MIIALAWLSTACSESKQNAGYQDSVRVLRLVADNSFGILVSELKQAYEARYPKARVELTLASEPEAIALFREGKCEQILLARKFSEEETKKLNVEQIYPNWWHIANEAVAVVLHPNNPDTVLSIHQLQQIVSGSAGTWSQLPVHPYLKTKNTSWSGHNDSIIIAFDSKQPSIVNYLTDTLFKIGKLGKVKLVGKKNSDELLAFVAQTPNAIGFVNVHHLYYADAPTSAKYAEKVEVAKVSTKPDGAAFKPIHEFVWNGSYPLVRKVFLISRDSDVNLGSGFAKYATDENTGQKLIDNLGMAPAEGITRLVRYQSKAVELESGLPK